MSAGRAEATPRGSGPGGQASRAFPSLLDRIDVRPWHMLGAQPVGAAEPSGRKGCISHALERRQRRACADPQQAIGGLLLRVAKILCAGETQQCRDELVAGLIEDARLPPECGGGVAQRADRVSAIVLTVAPAAHSVFPRLAPMDRADADDDAAAGECRCPCRVVDLGASLQYVVATQVVVDAGLETGEREHSRYASVGCRLPLEGLQRSAQRVLP